MMQSWIISIVFIYLMNVIYAIPIPTDCDLPSNLSDRYQHFTGASKDVFFFSLMKESQMKLDEVDSKSTESVSEDFRKTSSCPWNYTTVYDSNLYPPFRTEAVCISKNCYRSSSVNQCVNVYTKITFFKRANKCVNGIYVYKPIEIEVPTACTCAEAISLISPNKYENTEHDYEQ